MIVNYRTFTEALSSFKNLAEKTIYTCDSIVNSYANCGKSLGKIVGGLFGNQGSAIGSEIGNFGGHLLGEKKANRTQKYSMALSNIKKELDIWKKTGEPIINEFLESYSKIKETYEIELDYLKNLIREAENNKKDDSIKEVVNYLKYLIDIQLQKKHNILLGEKIQKYLSSYQTELQDLEAFSTWHKEILYIDNKQILSECYSELQEKIGNFHKYKHFFILLESELLTMLNTETTDILFNEVSRSLSLDIRSKKFSYIYPEFYYNGKGFLRMRKIAEDSYYQYLRLVFTPLKTKLLIKIPVVLAIILPLMNKLLGLFLKQNFVTNNSFFNFLLGNFFGNVIFTFIVTEVICFLIFLYKKRKLEHNPLKYIYYLIDECKNEVLKKIADEEVSIDAARIYKKYEKQLLLEDGKNIDETIVNNKQEINDDDFLKKLIDSK